MKPTTTISKTMSSIVSRLILVNFDTKINKYLIPVKTYLTDIYVKYLSLKDK